MDLQKESARAASNFGAVEKLDIDSSTATDFSGYYKLKDTCKIIGIFSLNNQKLDLVPINQEVLVLLDKSPFYGESGGQIGDRGSILNSNARFEVLDTLKQGKTHIHRGLLKEGGICVGDEVIAEVAEKDRQAITLNHSATHLMHSALRNVLGRHVAQKGSLVAADRLRFDFAHPSPVSEKELIAIEKQVNTEILANTEVNKEIMALEEAKHRGALALFGEKYGDEVRVVSMGGEYSVEFCGGCHVNRTGDIGAFKITSEAGISAGVRRIEAVTGMGALKASNEERNILRQLGDIVKSSPLDLVEKVQQLSESNRTLEKEVERLKAKLSSDAGDDLSAQALEIKGTSVLVANVEGFNSKSLRDTVDQLKNKLGSSIILLANVEDAKVSLIAGVSKNLTNKVKAGELVNMVAEQVGGKGGGRPDMAMAGGTNVGAVPSALESVKPWLEGKL